MTVETLSQQEFSTALHEATTLDFNDMRNMLTEIEQNLLGTDPTFQENVYSKLQNDLYIMLEQIHEGTLVKPIESLITEICLN